MKSVMGHRFDQIPKAEIQRSSFDRSHGYKTTFNAGSIIPFFLDEVYPGDTFNLRMTALARIATLIKPPMDNMFLDTHFFFVPMRLLWQNWEKFNGEQNNPADPTDFQVPQIVSPATTGWATGSLADYLGLPVGVAGLSVSALPFRCYNRIYRDWYRDQNLIDSPVISIGDGPDTNADYVVRKRAKRHDYFTSCLPWPQKGNSVVLPIAGIAPVKTTGLTPTFDYQGIQNQELRAVSTVPQGGTSPLLGLPGANPSPSPAGVAFGSQTGLQAELAFASPLAINQFREAFQLQRLLERDARGGSRYPEILKAHFGVTDPQFDVLQRPQYLGGGTTPVSIHSVPQTSASGAYADEPQANLAAYGTIQAHGHGFTKSFTEHGLVMGLMSVRADLTYQQGIDKMWSRKTRFEFYWPALSHLGEQSVLNKEIYAQGTSADEQVFGYQERFAELRFKTSKITGKFKSNETGGTPLDFWHLSQDFANLPTLNQQFIEENPPIDRIIAVTTEPHFLFDSYIKLICARPLPTYGVPGMVDHF